MRTAEKKRSQIGVRTKQINEKLGFVGINVTRVEVTVSKL